MIFADRAEAGRKLAQRLLHLKNRMPVVLALVRGGLPVGFEVARTLDAPLDIILVRKIGVPGNPELAAGAVVDGPNPETVINSEIVEELGVPEAYLESVAAQELLEIERRRQVYLGKRPRALVRGRAAIVVDDGIATGATTRAALHAVRRQNPAHLVLAVPVAPGDTIAALRTDADEIVCLSAPVFFGAIGYFYEDFRQVDDEQVIDLLHRSRRPEPAQASPGGNGVR